MADFLSDADVGLAQPVAKGTPSDWASINQETRAAEPARQADAARIRGYEAAGTGPVKTSNVIPGSQATFFARNQPYVQPGEHNYNTQLRPSEEAAFRDWVQKNNVPFASTAKTTDYDMRGFWKALQAGDPTARSAIDPNDKQLHYPDRWKTPYHETFSHESHRVIRG